MAILLFYATIIFIGGGTKEKQFIFFGFDATGKYYWKNSVGRFFLSKCFAFQNLKISNKNIVI